MKRGWLEHEVFQPKGVWSKAEAWIWIVENACYKPTKIDIGGKPYTVPRGALCYSERFLAGKFHWSRKALRTFISQLEAHGAAQKSVAQTGPSAKQKRAQITLCNYDKYQAAGTNTNEKRNQKGTKEEQGNNTSPIGEGADAPTQNLVSVSVVTVALWSAGKQYLATCGVKNPGAVIGRWLKVYDAVPILNAIEASQKSGTQDPVPYITEILKGGQHGRPPSARQRDDIALREYARRVSAGEINRGPDPSDPWAG